MSSVLLNVGGHPVAVPKMMDLPVRTVMKIVSEPDPKKQFSLALDALCECITFDAVSIVDNMTVDQAIELVKDWMEKSQPVDREEPEIV